MCDHWPLELAVNGHWYGALEVRRSAETCSEVYVEGDRAPYVGAAK